MLVHYSAGPYAFFVGLHYLLAVWWRRHQWAEAAIIASVCVAILGSWFGWSVAHYGPKITFASNSTVTDSAPIEPCGKRSQHRQELVVDHRSQHFAASFLDGKRQPGRRRGPGAADDGRTREGFCLPVLSGQRDSGPGNRRAGTGQLSALAVLSPILRDRGKESAESAFSGRPSSCSST